MGAVEQVRGAAQGRLVTLDVDGDTLTWRMKATSRAAAENIVTTLHQVRDAKFEYSRVSVAMLFLLVAGAVVGLLREWRVAVSLWGAAVAIGAQRALRPRRLLVLDLGTRSLTLDVAADSVGSARALVGRIAGILKSGETPAVPPTLP